MSVAALYRTIQFHATTAFLFTKSDIKTTVIPIVSLAYDSMLSAAQRFTSLVKTVFAIVSAPLSSLTRIPHIVLWIWVHLLQFDVSNQTLRPEEDVHNKSDRPLPSGRIELQNAIRLRWMLVPVCFLLSLCYSVEVLYSSIALVALTIIYDELNIHAAHWAARNIVNGLGFASFESGATLIAGMELRYSERWSHG